jgi:thymidylate synthase
MNSLDKQYKELLKTILTHGVVKEDRTGTGTKSIFGYTIRHNMAEGFPLLTTKKMAWKTLVTELLWFLRGDTNIKYLVDNDCHIWDGDAYKNYAWKTSMDVDGQSTKEEFINKIKTDDEFAKKWGELGPIYGKQWRHWSTMGKGQEMNGLFSIEENMKMNSIDQIQNLISELKTNPDSRRLMVSAWNVGELDQMVLPPCHYGFQVYTRSLTLAERIKTARSTYPNFNIMDFGHSDGISEEEFQHQMLNEKYPELPQRAISLMWNQRSVDTFLGLPFNIASYGLLLSILAKEVNMIPDQLIGNLGDTHLYLNHLDQAKEQMKRKGFNLPQLSINPNNEMRIGGGISTYVNTDFTLEGYESHPAIKAPLSN